MLPLDGEELLPLGDAGRLFAAGPVYSTLYDWMRLGVTSKVTRERVKLECRQEGAAWFTSVEAVERFKARLNGAEV